MEITFFGSKKAQESTLQFPIRAFEKKVTLSKTAYQILPFYEIFFAVLKLGNVSDKRLGHFYFCKTVLSPALLSETEDMAVKFISLY